jgi:hypothetical protein
MPKLQITVTLYAFYQVVYSDQTSMNVEMFPSFV